MDKGEWSEQRKLGRVGRSTNWGGGALPMVGC